MRTTLTLDEDVVALLEQVRQQRKASLKEVVNTALRGGLVAMTQPPETRPVFRTRAFDTGKCRLSNIDNIAEVLAIVEGEGYQ